MGVDRDPAIAVLAEANVRLLPPQQLDASRRVAVAEASARHLDELSASAWHIDPDRRPQGRRTTRVALHEPPPDAIDQWLSHLDNAAVKLAPAAELPPHWAERAEQEWISRGGVCRQLVAWFGTLATAPGRRRATVISTRQLKRHGAAPGESLFSARSIVGSADQPAPTADGIGSFLFEPDAAVLAAGLSGVLAAEHGLAAIAPQSAYWTGQAPIDDPALAAFAVNAVMPYDQRRVKAHLREQGIGRLEVKQRAHGARARRSGSAPARRGERAGHVDSGARSTNKSPRSSRGVSRMLSDTERPVGIVVAIGGSVTSALWP